VLVHVVAMEVVQVSAVEVVSVPFVHDRRMPTVGAVYVTFVVIVLRATHGVLLSAEILI
jgi:hypothetical protein